MRWIDILAWSMNNLRRRKLRSALTMLGVVFGTMAIVVTISLGFGAQETSMRELDAMMNLRLIRVYPYWGRGPTEEAGRARITRITDQVLARMRRIKNIAAMTPVVEVWPAIEFSMMAGKLETYCPLVAVDPTEIGKFFRIKQGRGFTRSTDRMEFLMSEIKMVEFRDPKKEDYEWVDVYEYLRQGQSPPLPKIDWLNAAFTWQMRWEDYNDTSPGSDPIKYTKDYKAKMMGVIEVDPDDYSSWSFSSGAIVNLNWLKKLARDNRAFFKEQGVTIELDAYQQVYVLAKSVDNVEEIVKALEDIGVQPENPLVYIKQMQEQIATVQAFLGFIGAVSMFVAALSIANTMMMSIYERTREIGVMKVLGCRLNNIRMLFLSEAAYIGLFGGLVGLILSYALSYALNNVEALQTLVASVLSSSSAFSGGETTSVIPPALSLGTWAGVVAISIISGLYPAHRAMQLSSLAAIRNAD